MTTPIRRESRSPEFRIKNNKTQLLLVFVKRQSRKKWWGFGIGHYVWRLEQRVDVGGGERREAISSKYRGYQ